MRIVKQKTTLSIDNRDLNSAPVSARHGALLPSTIRCLIIGPSNCGKTNVMISLLLHENGLRFENVYIYSKSLTQPKYTLLENILTPIKGINYFKYNNCENIIKPFEAKTNSVFIFDDVSCDKQDTMREYFSMGRHNKIDCFYLCQTYTRIPKHLVRDNANLLLLFRLDELNLRHAYNEHVNTDLNYDQFKAMCAECWREKYGFLVINKECQINKGRFRKGFDQYIIP